MTCNSCVQQINVFSFVWTFDFRGLSYHMNNNVMYKYYFIWFSQKFRRNQLKTINFKYLSLLVWCLKRIWTFGRDFDLDYHLLLCTFQHDSPVCFLFSRTHTLVQFSIFPNINLMPHLLHNLRLFLFTYVYTSFFLWAQFTKRVKNIIKTIYKLKHNNLKKWCVDKSQIWDVYLFTVTVVVVGIDHVIRCTCISTGDLFETEIAPIIKITLARKLRAISLLQHVLFILIIAYFDALPTVNRYISNFIESLMKWRLQKKLTVIGSFVIRSTKLCLVILLKVFVFFLKKAKSFHFVIWWNVTIHVCTYNGFLKIIIE